VVFNRGNWVVPNRGNPAVMGTHGRKGLIRLAIGSDAESVVREAPVPVLLVHSIPPVVETPTPKDTAAAAAAVVYA
jgi:hypothetical protein